MIKQLLKNEEKVYFEEGELYELLLDISCVNQNVKPIFEDLGKSVNSEVKYLCYGNLKSLYKSINKLKLEMEKYL